MKVYVTGSCGLRDPLYVGKAIKAAIARDGIEVTHIIVGNAVSVDFNVKNYARKNHIRYEVMVPDWRKHGRDAWKFTYDAILEKADYMVAIWDGVSIGVKYAVDLARVKNKPFFIFKVESSA